MDIEQKRRKKAEVDCRPKPSLPPLRRNKLRSRDKPVQRRRHDQHTTACSAQHSVCTFGLKEISTSPSTPPPPPPPTMTMMTTMTTKRRRRKRRRRRPECNGGGRQGGGGGGQGSERKVCRQRRRRRNNSTLEGKHVEISRSCVEVC